MDRLPPAGRDHDEEILILLLGDAGIGYGTSTLSKDALEAHVELMLTSLTSQCISLEDMRDVPVGVTLVAPTDLISFSRGLGGRTPPVQVSAGRLSGIVLRINLGAIEVMYESCNRDLLFEDDQRLIGACLYREERDLKLHLPGERGLIARPANSQAVYVLCKTAGEGLERHNSDARMLSSPTVSETAFWQAVDEAVNVLSKNYSKFDVDDHLVVPAKMIVPILEGFRSALAVHETSCMDRRDQLLGKFYALAKQHAFANVEEIARSLSMTRRNLHYYASSRLGIAPKKLIKSMALSKVMCQLPANEARASSIADIAFQHGFESPAQFSADYRKHFGELPSETRRRYQ